MSKKWIGFIAGLGLGACITYVITNYLNSPEPPKETKRYQSYYNMLAKWLEMEEKGKPVDVLLKEAGYKKIAVYGMGNIGKRLCKVLQNTEIDVEYGIDGQIVNDVEDVPVLSLDDVLPEVDAIVVTVPFAYVDIKKKIEEKIDYPVISLEHIIFEV